MDGMVLAAGCLFWVDFVSVCHAVKAVCVKLVAAENLDNNEEN